MGKRKPGRPASKQAGITAAQKAAIYRGWLRNVPLTTLAKRIGCDHSTVAYWVQRFAQPQTALALRDQLHIEIAKVAELERVAWLAWNRSRKPGHEQTTRESLKDALEEEGLPSEVVERVTREIGRDGDWNWLKVVQWAIDWRCKVAGHYAQDRAAQDLLRVANLSRDELDNQLARRIEEIVKRVAR